MGLAEMYGVPTEVMAFVDSGFLQLCSENEAEKTVTFFIPDLQYDNELGQSVDFTIIWIHPDFNAQFCHFYHETPGDLSNFYVFKETEDNGEDSIDVPTLDDLIAWLDEKNEIARRRH